MKCVMVAEESGWKAGQVSEQSSGFRMLMVYVYGILVGCLWDIEYGIYEVEESGMEYQLSRLGGKSRSYGYPHSQQ